MKNDRALLFAFLIVPFFLFSQNLLPTATDAQAHHQMLAALAKDSTISENITFAAADEEPRLIKRVEPKYPAVMLKNYRYQR